jgi:hypothetical protein
MRPCGHTSVKRAPTCRTNQAVTRVSNIRLVQSSGDTCVQRLAASLPLVTFTAMPVSTTHAIVGGTVGAAAVGAGWNCLNWKFRGGLLGIIASWVISPVLSVRRRVPLPPRADPESIT